MGMRFDEAVNFFIKTLEKMGFIVEDLDADGELIRAHKGEIVVSIRFKQLQNAFMHIPRTEVLIEAPEYVHDTIKQHIMRSKAGG